MSPGPMVEIRGASRRFPGGHYGVRGVTLEVERGETLVIMGPSGSGKSTLLRCVNGLERLDEGEIIIDGMRVDHQTTDWNKVREEVGMVFQGFHLFPNRTALDNLVLPQRVVRRRAAADAERNARGLLERVGLGGKESRFPAELSGGEKQRVAIARALAMNPKVLLFDEPTSALDPEMILEVLDVMRDLAREGMTMLVVTHEIGFAREAAQRAVFLDQGVLVEAGPARDLIDRPETARCRAFMRRILRRPESGGEAAWT
ncbi:MAG TPA: amino acid ABC transporter ATP-binding protein [Candidatus Eisenbacteria bacterium]